MVRAEDTAALYIRLDSALRPPAAPPLDPAPDRHQLRLLRNHQPGPQRSARLPDPRGPQRVAEGEGAADQGVRTRPAHPRAVLAIAQARDPARLRALLP